MPARGWKRSLAVLAGLAVGCLALARPATAFPERTHRALVQAALDRLPNDLRVALMRHKAVMLEGVTDGIAQAQATRAAWVEPRARLDAAVERLEQLEALQGEVTPYAAYALGRASVELAHASQPYGLYGGAGVPDFMAAYEALFDAALPVPVAGRGTVAPAGAVAEPVGAAWRAAAIRQAAVRTDAAGGFRRDSATVRTASHVLDATAQTLATAWVTALRPRAGVSVSPSGVVRVSLDQARWGAAEHRWDEVRAALDRLERARVPVSLSPGSVGRAFFHMHEHGAHCDLYATALRVDPKSSRLRAVAKTCEDGGWPHEAPLVAKRWGGRNIPAAADTGIRAAEHRSGTLHLTNKELALTDAFIPLNFEPIKPFTPKPKQKGDAPTVADAARAIRESGAAQAFDLEEVIAFYAEQYRVDPLLVKAVMYAESNFDPNVVSRAGARGLMQLMPSTALEMGVEDIFDPVQNVAGGTQYLSLMLQLFDGDEELALAAYNAGPGTVKRFGGVPPYEETRRYVPKVLRKRREYARLGTRVALNGTSPRPAKSYLPPEPAEPAPAAEAEAPPAPVDPLQPHSGVVIVLQNGLTMRGKDAVESDKGVKLEVDTGWILVPTRHIDRVIRATG